MFKMSKSRVKMFEGCPRRFEITYIKGFREPSNIFMRMGIDIHKIFENFYGELINQDKEITHELIDLAMKKYWDKRYEIHLKNFLRFNHWILDKESSKYFLPLAIEKQITIKELNLVGIIDAVYKTENRVILIDFKTGSDRNRKQYHFELGLYKYLWDSLNECKITHYGIIFSKTDRVWIIPATDEQVEKSVKKLKSTQEMIESLVENDIKDYPKTTNSDNCTFCGQLGTRCKGADFR